MRTKLPAEEIRGLLSYDPNTGWFKYPSRTPSGRKSAHPSGVGGPDDYGYHQIGIQGRQYKSHQLAWVCYYGQWPPGEIDHINGVRDDNRIANLRVVTRRQNQINRACQRNNALGVKGVHKITLKCGAEKFRVRFNVYGKHHHIGCFDTLEEATRARDAAMLALHGEYARKDCDR